MGIEFQYTFSISTRANLEEVGSANLYLFRRYFHFSNLAKMECLDAISGGAISIYENLFDQNEQIAKSISSTLPHAPHDLLLLEDLEVKKVYRSRGIGERILKLLIDRHSNLKTLFVTTASPTDPDGMPAEEDPAYDQMLEQLTRRLHHFYQRLGFLLMRERENAMYLPFSKPLSGD